MNVNALIVKIIVWLCLLGLQGVNLNAQNTTNESNPIFTLDKQQCKVTNNGDLLSIDDLLLLSRNILSGDRYKTNITNVNDNDSLYNSPYIITDHTYDDNKYEYEEASKPLHLALKTNLLYDLGLLPNLTVEWYFEKFDRQWSLAVEGNWNWWTFGSSAQTRQFYRIQAAGIELRRWVESPYPLHGHAVGVYSMIGNYDLRFFTQDEYSKGYLSNLSWSAGLSYSWSVPISSGFNVELGLALGYIGGRYYQYDYCTIHQHWAPRAAYNRNYIGPTRVGVSFVWLLGTGNGKDFLRYK